MLLEYFPIRDFGYKEEHLSLNGTNSAFDQDKMNKSGWIIKLPGRSYIKHPRGQLTQSKAEAYAWYYKKDAQKAIRKDPDVRLMIHQQARKNPNDVVAVEQR